MNMDRPDPDALLKRVKAEEARARRGSLKIFFGYAAGVGKTYAMLEAARRAHEAGREVVIGYVEPHGRKETEALLEGLESLPPLAREYRGVQLREFDVDAALARRPDLILVDELAHTNAEGCRHAKRWQDVEELLDAGIHVWTTLNVQHIESLNDVIGGITGVAVRETVPDGIFDLADDLELIDLTPEELIDRLKAGKVYLSDQAERALGSFFQKGNLVALREFSLRQAARRVHSDVESARRQQAVSAPWATSDRLMVCVGPSPSTSRVIRTAKRLANALDADWIAVSIECVGVSVDAASQEQVAAHFRLAERLGAETATLSGERVAATLLEYARARNVSKILIGKTHQPLWKRLIFGTIVDDVLDRSGDIDVYVIQGEDEPPREAGYDRPRSAPDWSVYARSVAVMAVAHAVALGFHRLGLSEANVVMAYLAAVGLIAALFGRWPAVVASVAAVSIFDFFFVPPAFTFAVTDTEYLVTFGVMLAIGLLISSLTARLRAQLERAEARESRLSMLYKLGKQLSSLSGAVFLSAAAGRKVADFAGGEVVVYLGERGEAPEIAYGQKSGVARHPVSEPTARWVIDHDQVAGAGTDTLPNAPALFVPLTGSQGTVGAIAVGAARADRLLEPEQRRLLGACASQLALAIERDRMSIAASEAQVRAQAEQVRNALLSGVSHDLRTPLAAIAGASSSLLRRDDFDDQTRRQLLETIADEANRLTRLLENILQMSRLELGEAAARKQWNILEEIVGSAIHRTRQPLGGHAVEVRMPPDLPLVHVDALLLEQVFVNLLENAARHTPPGTRITISARRDGDWLVVSTADDGPGLPPGEEEKIFEKFYRASPSADSGRGSGLGLAICRAVARAHGGSIVASNRPGAGVEFVLRLPLDEHPPSVDPA